MATKGDRNVGASAKLQRARELNAMGMLNLKPGTGFGGASERMYSTLLIIFLAGLTSWRLSEGPLKTAGLKSGVPVIDEMVLAPAPVYMGDVQMDWGIAIAIRAVLLLLVAGIIPALSWMWAEILDRPLMSPYRVVWAMTLVVAVIALFMEPVFGSIMGNFMMLAK